MISYLFTNEKKRVAVERDFPMGKAPEYVRHHGVRCKRDRAGEIAGRGARASGNWPMFSLQAAVDPDQVPGQIEHFRRHGVEVEFKLNDGDALMKFDSPRHRTKCLRVMGMVDRDGGYAETYQGSDRD